MNHINKIAYISVTALSDCDLPLIYELSKEAMVDYFFLATNTTRQGTVININLKEDGGIFPGTMYPELNAIAKWIDLNHVFVVNKPVNHDWEWLNFKVSWQWMRMLKDNNYNIIHITWPLRYCSFPLYFLRKKMILTLHDPIPHSSHLTIENRFHRWCSIHFTPDIILLNRTQKDEFMKKYHVNATRIHSSKLSIYSHLKDTIPAQSLCQQPYILYLGSILPHKGVEYLCQAMMPIISDTNNIKVVIAGKGQYYFNKATYEANSSYIFINRFITDEEVASLIINCIAVVCPYIDATQSGVIMSAFALEKPVIATRVGALPEMMKDGRHGFLIAPKDYKELEKAIRRMIQPGVAEQMSKNIKKDYSLGKHSWHEIARGLLAIYEKSIDRRR